MEVIGAVSGVVALVESTSKMAKSLTNLARRWTDAPEGKRWLYDVNRGKVVTG